MPPPPMFDTNVLISGAYNAELKLVRAFFVSAVVVQELLAGRDKDTQRIVIEQANELDRRKLLIVPNKEDWCEVGKCLRKLFVSGAGGVPRFPKEYVSSLVRDALIARCAIRADAQLVTSNTVDFDRIKSVFKGLRHTTPSTFFGTRPR
jgi:predicted nucleic acid-binding protein